MEQSILYLVVDGLLGFLIVRGARVNLLLEYPLFYIYLIQVLILDVVKFYIYTFWTSGYPEVFWYSQFLSLILGYCVIWELYSRSLSNYPGVVKIARAIVSTALILVLAKFLNNALTGPAWGAARTVGDLERDIRAVQAVLLIVLSCLMSYYAIPLGRNLKGIVCGYGFFIGTRIVYLAIRSHLGEPSQSSTIWTYVSSIAYVMSLIMWCYALRSYQRIPEPETDVGIEEDYRFIVERTVKSIARARHLIGRTIRA